jgi:hypothetical protein
MPFMFPLPRFASRVMTAPLRILLKEDRPGNGKELVVTFVIYATILVLLSLPFVLLNWPTCGWMDWPSYTLYRKAVPAPPPEHWLSLEECRSVCASEEYMEVVSLPSSEARPDMAGGAPCVVEGSEQCGERGGCRCFCSGEVKPSKGF